MFCYECDWCGGSIDIGRETMVRANIEIIGTSRDYRGKRETTAEPTRFFHANPIRSLDEWDRLGVEIEDESLGDCCYTRALKAIEGQPEWATPDAGMEWRLVPVGATIQEKAKARGSGGPLVVPPDAGLSELLASFAPSPSQSLRRALESAGISTLGQLEAMSDDELMATPRIGWTTRTKIRAFLAARIEQPRDAKRLEDAIESDRDHLYTEAVSATDALANVLEPDGLLRLSCRAFSQAVGKRLGHLRSETVVSEGSL